MTAPALVFELERGDLDGEEARDPVLDQATVWPVEGAAGPAQLAERFAAGWADWYGPALAGHAAAIAALLDHEARTATVDAGTALQLSRDGGRLLLGLPWSWALPVIRRRERSLRIGLAPQNGTAAWLEPLRQYLPASWRRSRAVRVQLGLRMRMHWGALAEPAPGPGGVSWLRCRVRADALALTPRLWALDHGHARTLVDGGVTLVERRLRGGIGLMLVQPVLRCERDVPASRLRQGGQALLRRLAGSVPHDPAFRDRLAVDEGWWARALSGADAALLARAARRGWLLQPASRPALRHGSAAVVREHVVLLADSPAGVRDGFAPLLAPVPQADAVLWPGLPLLDNVAAWRFERDWRRPLDQQLAALATALDERIVAPAGPLAPSCRIVFVGYGSGGCVARFALEPLRERWARRGWRVEALTIGSPHLGASAAALDPAREPLADWPPGLADLLPEAVQRRAGGDAERLPSGMWLLGSAWGAAGTEIGENAAHVIDDLDDPSPGDGHVSLRSALAGRRPGPPPAGVAPPDDGIVAIDVSPIPHDRYLASPAVRRAMQRALDHLLGREGSWA